jgi:arginase family enzyme
VDRPLSVSVLRSRTSDRADGGRVGAERLGALLGEDVRLLGEPEAPRAARWEEDLRDARAALTTAAAVIAADGLPVLLASDCSIAVATLPAAVSRTPDVRVVWLDAHGDFNTPASSPSGYLGGMCLAAACGRWDAGYGPAVDPARVVLCDARDLDPAERDGLDGAGVARVAPAAVADAVRGRRVFLHLDCDILDPALLPAAFPAPGGLSFEALGALLAALGAAADLVGAEVTSVAAEAAEPLADVLMPLLRTPPPAAAR